MIFESVAIKDFMAIRSAEVSLNQRGLVTVAGENHVNSSADSNGSGKSTLGAAICWCLFNKTDRGITGDDVIRNGTKEAIVELRIKEGDDVYVITRSRRKAKGITEIVKRDKDGNINTLTGGTEALTQNIIESIIGSTHEVFCAAVYMQQENLICLPEMNDRGLKELVEQAAGLTELAEAFVVAKDNVREMSARADNATAKVEAVLFAVNATKDLIASHKESAEKEKVAEEERRKAFERAKVSFQKNAEQIMEQKGKLPPMSKLIAARELLKKKLDSVAEQNDIISQADLMLATKNAEASGLRRQAERAKAEMMRCKEDISKANARIGTHCSECGSIITEDHLKDVKESLRKKYEQNFDAYRKNMKEAEDIEVAAKEERAKVPAERVSATDIISKIEKVDRGVDQIKAIDGAIESLEKKMSEEYVPSVPLEIPETLQDTLKRRIEDHAKAVREADQAQADLLKAQKIMKVFDVGGVRAQVLDSVTPFLNEKTAEYLAVLTDGTFTVEWTTLTRKKDGSIKEKFSIDVKHLDTGKGFKSCSGGEKRRVSLACALALQDLVSARATKPINLLIADEIDDALDVSGLERLMSVMQEKSKTRGTILVISHNDLKSWIGNSITVIKGKDGSVVQDD